MLSLVSDNQEMMNIRSAAYWHMIICVYIPHNICICSKADSKNMAEQSTGSLHHSVQPQSEQMYAQLQFPKDNTYQVSKNTCALSQCYIQNGHSQLHGLQQKLSREILWLAQSLCVTLKLNVAMCNK